MHNWFPVTRGHYKESSVIGMGWGQWRTRSVSLTKVSHSPNHDPHTYHTHTRTRTRTCPSRRVRRQLLTDHSRTYSYSYTIFHELDIFLNTFSSNLSFPFSCPFHYLNYTFSHIILFSFIVFSQILPFFIPFFLLHPSIPTPPSLIILL